MSIKDLTETNGKLTWERTGSDEGKEQLALSGATTEGPFIATLLPESARSFTVPSWTAGLAYGVVNVDEAAIKQSAAPVTPPVTPPVVTATVPIGGAQCAIDSTPTIVTVGNQTYLMLQGWQTQLALWAKTVNPSIKCLMYKEVGACSEVEDGQCDSGVPYPTALAAGYLLLANGSPFILEGFSGQYAADPGNSGYINAWITNVIAELKASNGAFDGVHMDDVNPVLPNAPSGVVYPNGTYTTAMTKFVAAAGPALATAGYLSIANIGSWGNYPTVCDAWIQYLSGAICEMWCGWDEAGGMGHQGEAVVMSQIESAIKVAAANKILIAFCQAVSADESDESYCTAALLVAGDSPQQAIYFSAGGDYATAVWPQCWSDAVKLGAPTAAATQSAQGVYFRPFENGWVGCNASGESVSINGVSFGAQSGRVVLT